MPSSTSQLTPDTALPLEAAAPSRASLRSSTWLSLLLLAFGWIALYLPILAWLGRTLGDSAYRLNLLLLLGITGLLGKRWWEQREDGIGALGEGNPRNPTTSPWLLAALGSGGYVLVSRLWDANILAAACMGLATYGVLGLFTTPARWRRGWPAALLLIAALPFGAHLDQLVGFPARVLTAQWSAKILASFGVGSLSTQSILVLENGIAHVDMPCSGIKSLWSGGLFFLALTWIEGVSMRLRWLLCGVLYVATLLVANVVRVCLLILVAIVAEQPAIADVIHVPLGIVGFCIAGGLIYLCFQRLKPTQEHPEDAEPQPPQPGLLSLPSKGLLALACVLWLLVGLRAAWPQPAQVSQRRGWEPTLSGLFPHQSKLSLTVPERRLFQRHGKTAARKLRFGSGGPTASRLKGSLLLVHSRTWRSHHPPEICLAGGGHKVRSLHSVEIGPSFKLRYIALQGGKSAVYWYQSRRRATDILLTRILGSLRKSEKQWVMVSILFDRPIAPRSPRARALFLRLYQRIQQSL